MKLLRYQDFILRSLFKENILLNLKDNSIKLPISVLSNKYKTRNTDNLIGIEVGDILISDISLANGVIEITINGDSVLIFESTFRRLNTTVNGSHEVLDVLISDANTLTITDYYCSNVDYYDDSYNLTPKPINTVLDLVGAINKALSNNFDVIKDNGISNISIPINLAYTFSSLEGFEEYPSVILSTLDEETPENMGEITYREVFDLTPETYGELRRKEFSSELENEAISVLLKTILKLYPNYRLTDSGEDLVASTKKDCIIKLNLSLFRADEITGTLPDYIKAYYTLEEDTPPEVTGK